MWFRLPMLLACAALPVAIAVTTVMLRPGSTSDGASGRAATVCDHIRGNAVRYCGRATARLSVFPTARFRQGSCVRKRAGGTRLLQVRIGARSLDGSRTNDGLAYFSLGITDSRSQRVSGNVLAYYRSRRWIGRISSFNGGEDGGTFITLSIAASARHATGRFSC